VLLSKEEKGHFRPANCCAVLEGQSQKQNQPSPCCSLRAEEDGSPLHSKRENTLPLGGRKVKQVNETELDYEPSITDCNMFSVYIGDLVKEIETGKIWIVDDIGKNFIIGKIGEQTNYMSTSKFLWVASPKLPIGKGWK
jgi:hypothetical protein